MACSDPTNPAPESAGGDCADCEHKTGMHYMRQNGSFGCRLCSSASEHHPAESAGHVHTYNMAGVCVTCGRDADALATDHHFCENDDSPTRGATMVLDMLARIVTSDRDDADVGLMVRRVLNEPTLKAIRKAASAPAAPEPRETRCDPDVPHYYGLPATGCFNCFPPGSPDPYAPTDDGKGASPESAGREPWIPKNQPQPADVVPSITGDSGEVWIFQGVKVATHTDINAAFAMRDKINQAAEQWLTASGYATQQDRHGALSTPAAPQPETEPEAPKFRNVGNGRCLYCDDVGNLHRRVDQPDGHMVCYDCSRAYRLGWTAAKKGGR